MFSLPREIRRDLKARDGVEAQKLRHDAGALH